MAVLTGLVVLLPSTRASAHHHIGCANDTTKTETVAGRISQIDWVNPHVHIHLDSTATGDSTNWNVETQGPSIMARQGLPQSALNIGDTLRVELWRAKDGSPQGFTKSMMLHDGQTFAFNIVELRCPW